MEAQYNMSSGNENEQQGGPIQNVTLPPDALAHKVNVNDLMNDLADDKAGNGNFDQDDSLDGGVDDEYSEDDISDIDDDIGGGVGDKPAKGKRFRSEVEDDSDDDESDPKKKKDKPELFRANKMNPMLYSDKQDRQAKRSKREEKHEQARLSKNSYYQDLREDYDERPEEVHALGGMRKKSQYIKDLEKLEEVEGQTFSRMQWNKESKKMHKRMLKESLDERLDHVDDFKQLENIIDKRNQR